jgi:hypothetical protein
VSGKRGLGRSVWIFNHYAVGPGVPGGTRHYDIGRELAKRGWQVTVFSAAYPRREPPVRGELLRLAETRGQSGFAMGYSSSECQPCTAGTRMPCAR